MGFTEEKIIIDYSQFLAFSCMFWPVFLLICIFFLLGNWKYFLQNIQLFTIICIYIQFLSCFSFYLYFFSSVLILDIQNAPGLSAVFSTQSFFLQNGFGKDLRNNKSIKVGLRCYLLITSGKDLFWFLSQGVRYIDPLDFMGGGGEEGFHIKYLFSHFSQKLSNHTYLSNAYIKF